jgi:hypothetical protein
MPHRNRLAVGPWRRLAPSPFPWPGLLPVGSFAPLAPQVMVPLTHSRDCVKFLGPVSKFDMKYLEQENFKFPLQAITRFLPRCLWFFPRVFKFELMRLRRSIILRGPPRTPFAKSYFGLGISISNVLPHPCVASCRHIIKRLALSSSFP